MSETIWIAIITICISVMFSLLIGYWQVRTMRAIANPQQNQLNPRAKNALISLGFVIVVIIIFVVGNFIPFYILFYELTSDAPITRETIIKISFQVWVICYTGFKFFGLAFDIIAKEIKWQWEQYKIRK